MAVNAYTLKEDNYLRDNYLTTSHGDMAKAIGRSEDSVKCRCQRLRLLIGREEATRRMIEATKDYRESQMLNEAQDAFVKEHYLTMPIKTMAKSLGRTQTAIRGSLKRQGLFLPSEIIEKRKADSYFNENHVPHNKGRNMEEYVSVEMIDKIKQTCFKKGNSPHNTKQDGAITNREGYQYIRLSKGKWMSYHQWLWRQTYGDIPRGHIVVFKNGDSADLRLENLELRSRSEHALKTAVPKAKELKERLEDSYVRGLVKRITGMKSEDIPIELVELQRQKIRVMKSLKQGAEKQRI